MAVTEITTSEAPEAAVNPWDTGDAVPAAVSVFGTGDHKSLGRLWIAFSALFGVAALLANAVGVVDLVPDVDLVGDAAFQVATASQIGLALLFAVPLFVGVATYVTPLQVGAATVAFPRAAAAAFWTWLLGAVLLVVAYAIDGGVAGGRSAGVELAYLALGLVLLAIGLALVCVLTTIVAMRCPGLALDRVPLLSWSLLVAGAIWLLTLPVLAGNALLIYVDFRYGTPSSFGIPELQWSQLSWAFAPPQLFAYAIPVLGVVGDVVVTSAGVRQARRGVVLAGIGAFGILSFGAWAQPAFDEGIASQAIYVGVGIAILLPLLVVAGGLGTTVRSGGLPPLRAAWLGASAALLMLLLVGVGSVLHVIEPLELDDTAHFLAGLVVAVFGAIALAGIAACSHWGPKMTGRFANEALGKGGVTLALVGSLVGSLALMVAGFQTRIDVLADLSDALTWIGGIGSAVVGFGLVLGVLALVARGAPAGDDPWKGQSLEWATSSPPPAGNFGELEVVRSAEPMFDLRAEREAAS